MCHPQAESMLRDTVCFSQGILKAMLLHMIPLQKCLGGVFRCFYDLAGLWLQGMSCSGHRKLCIQRGWGALLWDWLPGTLTSTHKSYSHLLFVRNFRYLCAFSTLGLAQGCLSFCAIQSRLSSWAQLCKRTGTLWDTTQPMPQLSTAVPAACKRQTLSACVSSDAVQPPKAYSFCQLFFPFWILTFCCYLTL